MNKLMLNPEYNLYERKGQAFCSSRQVAEEFNKQHGHVLRDIEEITGTNTILRTFEIKTDSLIAQLERR